MTTIIARYRYDPKFCNATLTHTHTLIEAKEGFFTNSYIARDDGKIPACEMKAERINRDRWQWMSVPDNNYIDPPVDFTPVDTGEPLPQYTFAPAKDQQLRLI